jgi:hypothetical protein
MCDVYVDVRRRRPRLLTYIRASYGRSRNSAINQDANGALILKDAVSIPARRPKKERTGDLQIFNTRACRGPVELLQRLRVARSTDNRYAISGIDEHIRIGSFNFIASAPLNGDDNEGVFRTFFNFLDGTSCEETALSHRNNFNFKTKRTKVDLHLTPAFGTLYHAGDCRIQNERGNLLGANMCWQDDGIRPGLKQLLFCSRILATRNNFDFFIEAARRERNKYIYRIGRNDARQRALLICLPAGARFLQSHLH